MSRADHTTEWADAMLGAEALRPVRQGDDLQAGSPWGPRSLRKMTQSQRLAKDRFTRYEATGRKMLAVAISLVALGAALSAVRGWLS